MPYDAYSLPYPTACLTIVPYPIPFFQRQQYENNPWEAGCNVFQAPPDDVASLGLQVRCMLLYVELPTTLDESTLGIPVDTRLNTHITPLAP